LIITAIFMPFVATFILTNITPPIRSTISTINVFIVLHMELHGSASHVAQYITHCFGCIRLGNSQSAGFSQMTSCRLLSNYSSMCELHSPAKRPQWRTVLPVANLMAGSESRFIVTTRLSRLVLLIFASDTGIQTDGQYTIYCRQASNGLPCCCATGIC